MGAPGPEQRSPGAEGTSWGAGLSGVMERKSVAILEGISTNIPSLLALVYCKAEAGGKQQQNQ